MNAPTDTAGNPWKQHLLAVGFRLLCMTVIAFAGVVAGSDSPPERPDGSEQSPGVAGLLFVAGVVAAGVFAFIASTVHFLFRRRPLKTILLADVLLAAVFIVLMVWQGGKTKGQPKPAPPVSEWKGRPWAGAAVRCEVVLSRWTGRR